MKYSYIFFVSRHCTIAASEKCITKLPRPQDVTQLKRFLGMTSYMTKFLPNLATEADPLRKLEVKDMIWNCTINMNWHLKESRN